TEISHLVIDGADKASIGLYASRVSNVGNWFSNIIAQNTVDWGILGINIWGCRWSNICAYSNGNHGIQFGGDPFGLGDYFTVNSVLFDTLQAYSNGKRKDELVALRRAAGDTVLTRSGMIGEVISLYLHRGNTVTNITAEWNYGPALYLTGTDRPNTVS